MAGEHEGITCDRFEARAKVGGGRRRIIGVQGLEPRGERTAAARVPRDEGDGEAKHLGKLG